MRRRMDSTGPTVHTLTVEVTGVPMNDMVRGYLRSWRRIAIAVAAASFALPAFTAERPDFDRLAKSRYVHCAFYRKYDTDPATGDPIMVEGRANVLMHFQRIDEAHETAHAIYTRMAGQREVIVRHTAKAIHFIDNVEGMYLLTTVHNCLDYDEKRGICLTYGATHARVFDPAVLQHPDDVYERIKAGAEPGFCDHSFIGIQEAAKNP